MPLATVKEGTFLTAHRSVGQRAKGLPTGEARHVVKFAGVSPQNMLTHTPIPGVVRVPMIQM